MQLFYQFALMGIYLSALSDWTSRSFAIRNGKVLARATPWVLGHVLFHLAVLMAAFIVQGLHPVRAIAFFYTINALAMMWVIPSGITWGRLAGSAGPLAWRADFRSRSRMAVRVLEYGGLLLLSLLISGLPILFAKWETHPDFNSSIPNLASDSTALLFLGYLLVSAPLAEEPIFRQYLLCRLIVFFRRHVTLGQRNTGSVFRKRGPVFLSIAATTILFAAGHMHMIEPMWIKWYQISVLGVALGICQLRFGLLATIGLHFLLNAGSVAMVAAAR